MKITCLVDNTVAPGSPYWGEHGLAFLIETKDGRVLFDTGASGHVLLHNLRQGGVDPATISAVALSHGHHDHTGGLPTLLAHRRGPPIYFAHADLMRKRYSRHQHSSKSIGLPITSATLRTMATLRISTNPSELVPAVWTTGEITQRPEVEGRGSSHMIRQRNKWVSDPYRDDMALVVDGSDGLVLICGCCHAGFLNTLLHMQTHFGRPPVAVLGGTHLISANQEVLQHGIDVLRQCGSPMLHLNHCTGFSASLMLATAFGERFVPCPAGSVIEL